MISIWAPNGFNKPDHSHWTRINKFIFIFFANILSLSVLLAHLTVSVSAFFLHLFHGKSFIWEVCANVLQSLLYFYYFISVWRQQSEHSLNIFQSLYEYKYVDITCSMHASSLVFVDLLSTSSKGMQCSAIFKHTKHVCLWFCVLNHSLSMCVQNEKTGSNNMCNVYVCT